MTEVLLEAKAISKRFGGVVALKNIDLVQHRGETLGMIGPNGSGKTTFVNVISGHTRPNSGTVMFGGAPLAGRSPFQISAAGLTRTYQAVRVFGELTVRENVATALVDARDPAPREAVEEIAD